MENALLTVDCSRQHSWAESASAPLDHRHRDSVVQRLYVAVPLLVAGAAISQMNFDVVWRYFAWANQTLAMVVLWLGAVYLVRRGKPHWFATIPATFMTAVSATYLLVAPEGFALPTALSYPVGTGIAAAVLVLFLAVIFPRNQGLPAEVATGPTADTAREPAAARLD